MDIPQQNIVLIKNRFFSHTIHSNHSFCFLSFSYHPHFFLSPRSTSPSFPLQKRDSSQTGQNKIQDKTKQKPSSPHIKDGQGSPTEGKESQEQAKEIYLLPLLGVPQKHHANRLPYMHRDLVQGHAGSRLSGSISVNLA